MKHHGKAWLCLAGALALATPHLGWALSCRTTVTFSNHRGSDVQVETKSFYNMGKIARPAATDFKEEIPTGELPEYISMLDKITIPAGESVNVGFRMLCNGSLWLNWREIGPAGSPASGQLHRQYEGHTIGIE